MNQCPTSISRAALHQRVWDTTVIQLAAELGIAESRLRKLCARNNIPMPSGGGYWTLKKWAKAPEPTPLPINPPNQLAETMIVLPLPLTPIEQVAHDYGQAAIVPARLEQPLSCVQDTLAYLSLLAKGIHSARPDELLPLHVSPEQTDRALRIMDTLLKLVRIRGYRWLFRDERLYILVDGEEVRLRLRETKKRSAGGLHWTGMFRLQIHEDYANWEYNDIERPLESQIPKLLIAIEAASQKLKVRRKWRERRDAADRGEISYDDIDQVE